MDFDREMHQGLFVGQQFADGERCQRRIMREQGQGAGIAAVADTPEVQVGDEQIGIEPVQLLAEACGQR